LTLRVSSRSLLACSLCLLEKRNAPHPRMRCDIHGSTQLLQESHTRLLIFLHDNDCRRTKLPAYALTRPLRNALHQDILPELLSAGDSSSLLLSFSATLFFSAFLYSSLYAEGTGFVKGKAKIMLPPQPLLPRGTLPSLPSCHRTEEDSFSLYGNR